MELVTRLIVPCSEAFQKLKLLGSVLVKIYHSNNIIFDDLVGALRALNANQASFSCAAAH